MIEGGETSSCVYVLGAGVNRGLLHYLFDVRVPLARDFFVQLGQLPRQYRDEYDARLASVYDFIARYWHLSAADLRTVPFDLEECLTLLQLQLRDAERNGDADEIRRLAIIQGALVGVLHQYLSEFSAAEADPDFLRLAAAILESSSTVVTFNYDLLLEDALRLTSSVRESGRVGEERRARALARAKAWADSSSSGLPPNLDDWEPDAEIGVWVPELGYGPIRFDRLYPAAAGARPLVDGPEYYAKFGDTAQRCCVLKLHGSLSWFRSTGIRTRGSEGEASAAYDSSHEGRLYLVPHPSKGRELFQVEDGFLLEPLIITPVLDKSDVEGAPFRELWLRARVALENCRRLVVIGYSFPPTDFHTRRLFMEAFAERSPAEIVVVNPDTDTIATVRRLTRASVPVLSCRDLAEFVGTLPALPYGAEVKLAAEWVKNRRARTSERWSNRDREEQAREAGVARTNAPEKPTAGT